MTPVLSTTNLHKTYGRITAVDHLNLNIEAGSVFGLLGPNGSGKTTTLGMLLGVTRPTSGTFSWFGEAPNANQRKRIGAILEKPNFYPTISGYKNLQLSCKIKQTPESRIPEVIDTVDLTGREHDNFKTYSLGMKQRLAIASALLNNPEVLILDEPTNGLDPQGIAEIRALISSIATSGKTIILASHLLDEVQKVCDQFAILRNGKLIHTGKVADDFSEHTTIILASDDLDMLNRVTPSLPHYISHKTIGNKIELTCAKDAQASEINKQLAAAEIYLSHIEIKKKNLEEQFLEIVADHG